MVEATGGVKPMGTGVLRPSSGALVEALRGRARAIWQRLAADVLPWLLRGLVVIALVFVGLKELYFDNATFGAEPLKNCGSLVVWGFGVTAANKALGNLLPAPLPPAV
jgi:hypothetical protein